MKVEILSPSGYCAGVSRAISLALQARKENPDRQVYVLGMLVHNEQVTEMLAEKGIVTLCGKGKSLRELLSDIPENQVVVFTAHGHDGKITEEARKRNLIIYDAVCPKVLRNMEEMEKRVREGYEVIYIGIKGHPETEASLSISDRVRLYDAAVPFDYGSLKGSPVYVVNQTTLNYLELRDIHEEILARFPDAVIENEICPSTRKRQEAILSLPEDVDLIIIIGSTHSSNTKRLLEIARMSHPDIPAVMVRDEKGLTPEILRDKKHIVLSSGASTPGEVTDAVRDYVLRVTE